MSQKIEYEQLAVYNAERLRGILHDPLWIEYMAGVQERYNEEFGVDGLVVHSPESRAAVTTPGAAAPPQRAGALDHFRPDPKKPK